MFSLGQIAEIDLSNGRIDRYEYAPKLVHKFLAGRGFNVWYLSRRLSNDARPLGPENVIVFSCVISTWAFPHL